MPSIPRSVRLTVTAAVALVATACASAPAATSGGVQNAVPSASQTAIANAIAVANAPFVGSVKNKKYFPANCHTVKLIKSTDQVGFASMADAEQAGFSKDIYSTDCKY